VICVEVKGRSKSIDELVVELTENEVKTALELRSRYWLAIVESIPNNPRLWILKDPTGLMAAVEIHGEDIKEQGELWIE